MEIIKTDVAIIGAGGAGLRAAIALAEAAAEFAIDVLAPGGTFITKVFQGGTNQDLLVRLKHAFTTVKHAKPPSSRKGSPELFVIAQGKKAG